jgi:hypothetical protein
MARGEISLSSLPDLGRRRKRERKGGNGVRKDKKNKLFLR